MESSQQDEYFNWVNNRIIYSLSFILIIFELKEFIISWFPTDFKVNLFSITLAPINLINSMLIILLASLWLYGINYLIKNPLNKIKKTINGFASFLWFIFLIFPVFIIVLIFVHSAISQKEGIIVLIPLFFSLLGLLLSWWSQKQGKQLDLLILDKKIEFLKLQKSKLDQTSEFIRNYLVLEALVKKIFVEKKGVSFGMDRPINLRMTTNLLLKEKLISIQTKNLLDKVSDLRNKIVHAEHKATQTEIRKVEEVIKKLESDLKPGENG